MRYSGGGVGHKLLGVGISIINTVKEISRRVGLSADSEVTSDSTLSFLQLLQKILNRLILARITISECNEETFCADWPPRLFFPLSRVLDVCMEKWLVKWPYKPRRL